MHNLKIPAILLFFLCFNVSGNVQYLNIYQPNFKKKDNRELQKDDFIIRRSVDFNHNSLGAYSESDYKKNWIFGNLYMPNTTQINEKDGERVLANYYPLGTWGRGGGLNQWSSFEDSPDDIEELYLTYKLKFQHDFDWALGGKLPGVSFGLVQTVASGGAGPSIGDKGASLRLMWNKDGQCVLYIYHHAMTSKFGDDMGLKPFGRFERDNWHTITMRFVANQIGKANGIIQIWLDDVLVASSDKIEMRTSSSPKTIRGIALHTFMGGADSRFAPNKNQYMWMDDIYFWQYSNSYYYQNSNLARGLKLHPTNHHLHTPLQTTNPTFNLDISSFPKEGGSIKVKEHF
jgi:hypothetical protein